MSARLTLAAAAFVLAVGTAAAPAFAQDAPATAAPAAPPEAPPTAAEAAMQAKGQAFQSRMQQMNTELEAAMGDQTTDAAAKTAATNAILDRYQPDIDAFAGELETFFRSEAEKPENAADKAQLLAAADAAPPSIRNIPQIIRNAIQQALTTPPPAAAPQ